MGECGERARRYRGRGGWVRAGFRVGGAAEGGGMMEGRGGFGIEFGRSWISEMT